MARRSEALISRTTSRRSSCSTVRNAASESSATT